MFSFATRGAAISVIEIEHTDLTAGELRVVEDRDPRASQRMLALALFLEGAGGAWLRHGLQAQACLTGSAIWIACGDLRHCG